MSRHYLNVNFIPNADFTKTTEGLCGFMDDDETNDLIGPNGEQYNDAIQFAESCELAIFCGRLHRKCIFFCIQGYYMKKIKFSENNYLGRVTATHNGSGLVNSWNWNSSNFHADDVLDSLYTNEKHTPLYSLDRFSENQVEVSNIILEL